MHSDSRPKARFFQLRDAWALVCYLVVLTLELGLESLAKLVKTPGRLAGPPPSEFPAVGMK